jgi:hypothetical protein
MREREDEGYTEREWEAIQLSWPEPAHEPVKEPTEPWARRDEADGAES